MGRLFTAALSTLLLLLFLGASSQQGVHVQKAVHEKAAADKVRPKVITDCAQVGIALDPQSRTDSQSIGINWNRVMDLILDVVRKDIVKQGLDFVDLPDIHEEFKNKVLLVPVTGEFTAGNGSLGMLSTVERTGETRVTRVGPGFLVTCDLGLAIVELRYGHYRAHVRHVGSVSGRIKGAVGRNSVRVTARVDLQGGRCNASLIAAKVVELEGINVKVTGSGFGPLNWLITKATNSYAKNHRQEIVNKIEQALGAQVSKALNNFQCQQYVALLLL